MKNPVQISPLLFFPPVEFFYYLLNSDNTVFEIMETYPKQTYRNRCTIYAANGLLDLSIPVKKPSGNHTITKDIIISFEEEWKKKFWRALEAAYNSSPYFLFYKDEIEATFLKQENNLYKFNLSLLKLLCKMLDIRLAYKFSERYFNLYNEGVDRRNEFNPKEKSNKLYYPEYIQVFSEKFGFKENLSILDLLFNLGPEANLYLMNCTMHIPQ
ncbi:WbqC family protein [Bacteroidota bacterium]